jgi:DNA-binding NarL/FixJ family response regulator
MTVRVLVVDDHAVVREGIAAMLAREPDLEFVGEASNGLEALEGFRRLRPDIVLLDLQLPGMSGIEVLTQLRQEHLEARVIILTTYEGDVTAVRALKAGACGYLLKSSLHRELYGAIAAVHAGRRYVLAEVAQDIAVHAAEEPLTSRELDVLGIVAAGKGNKAIARQLGVSEDTVKAHLRSLFSKLDVEDRTQAVVVALRRGIISL